MTMCHATCASASWCSARQVPGEALDRRYGYTIVDTTIRQTSNAENYIPSLSHKFTFNIDQKKSKPSLKTTDINT